MNRRKVVLLLAGFAFPKSLMGMTNPAQDASEAINVEWVQRLLVEMSRVKPGDTRADLLRVFTTEGGISTALEQTYVSLHCPFFKVDVSFKPVGRPNKDKQGRANLDGDVRDRIDTISRPYLAFSAID